MKTLTFYEIDIDVDRFQYFLLEDESLYLDEMYHFDGSAKAEVWSPPEVVSLYAKRPEPDFWSFGLGGCGAVIAVRPEAFERTNIEYYLRQSAELLPLPYNGRQFRVFNVTECIDALDKNQTTFDYYSDGTIASVLEPVFRLDRLGEQVFKIPETALQKTYFVEDCDNSYDQLREYVDREALTGLVFKTLYSAEI